MTVKELRHLLHGIPERSMDEVNTKKTLMDFVSSESDFEVIDKGNWFYAVKKAINPTKEPIAFRGDMDAVCIDGTTPGHYCGHDGHSAILAGLAQKLSDETLERDIYLIFQPGEETGEGASICRSLLTEKKIGAIYGLHNIPGYPLGTMLLRDKTFACASAGVSMHFKGKTSHAAYPEQGNNPAVPMVKFTAMLDVMAGMLKEPNEILMLTVVGLNIGSDKYGVSAGEGTLYITLRGEHEEVFRILLARCKELAKLQAKEYKLELGIAEHDRFPATENHKDNVEKVKIAAESLGIKCQYLSEPMRWSEDFGWYLQKCPGAFFGLGAGKTTASLHTSGYEFPDELLETGIALFAELARG